MLTDAMIRDAWLRAEALCECRKDAHGHAGRCSQFLIWAERGETGRGGWGALRRDDPRRPPCEILCAACYRAWRLAEDLGPALVTHLLKRDAASRPLKSIATSITRSESSAN